MRQFIRIGLAWLALTGAACAQAQLGAGQVMGNSAAAQRPARAETVTAIFDRALGSTRGAIIERGSASWVLIGPGTAGLPFVSAGAGADPLYQLLGATGGGTGQGVYVIGDILYASTTTALSRLADVATGNALLSGGVGAPPSWGKVTSAHITGNALTKTDDTNVTATLGGSPTTALVNAASITLGWTGQLSIARGGTGAGTTQTAINAMHNCPPTRAGDLVYYNGTNWVCLAGNNSGTKVLQEDASGVPSWVVAGSGVTSVTAGGGLTASTNPIVATGTLSLRAPTIQVLTSGTGATYTTAAGVGYIRVIGCGGGGGGGTASAGAGGTTSFSASTMSATGGAASTGVGGTQASGGVGTNGQINYIGGDGIGTITGIAGNFLPRMPGGGSIMTGPTISPAANSCGGGGTNSVSGAGSTGGAGGGGGGFERIISSPAASYTYTIGAGGTAGTGGIGGGSGVIIVYEY